MRQAARRVQVRKRARDVGEDAQPRGGRQRLPPPVAPRRRCSEPPAIRPSTRLGAGPSSEKPSSATTLGCAARASSAASERARSSARRAVSERGPRPLGGTRLTATGVALAASTPRCTVPRRLHALASAKPCVAATNCSCVYRSPQPTPLGCWRLAEPPGPPGPASAPASRPPSREPTAPPSAADPAAGADDPPTARATGVAKSSAPDGTWGRPSHTCGSPSLGPKPPSPSAQRWLILAPSHRGCAPAAPFGQPSPLAVRDCVRDVPPPTGVGRPLGARASPCHEASF